MLFYLSNYISILVLFFIFLLAFSKFLPSAPLTALAQFLNRRGLFDAKDKDADEKIINFIRIIIGLILLFRLFWIGQFLFPLSPSFEESIYFFTMLFLTFCVFVGFLTPITILTLLLLQLRLNSPLSTYTLGMDVTAMLFVTFICYPAGRVLSIDAVLAKKHVWIASMYAFFTYESRSVQVTLAKFLSFLAYSLICLYSVIVHLEDTFWTTGLAAIELLTGTYLSRLPFFFQDLFSHSEIAISISKLSMKVMVAWYFVLFPFIIYGGIPRVIAITWSVLFFLVSAFVLQLSTLPYIEMLLLIVWFWTNIEKTPFIQKRLNHTTQVDVINNFSKCTSGACFFKPFFILYLVFSAGHLLAFPGGPLWNTFRIDYRNLSISAHVLGLGPINVFNHGDIGMTYQFFTVTQVTDTYEKLIPYTAPDGQRLSWHISDKVYFGNSLKWRRIKNAEELTPLTDIDKKFICQTLKWSEYFYSATDADYRFDFFTIKRPEFKNNLYQFFQPTKVDSLYFNLEDC